MTGHTQTGRKIHLSELVPTQVGIFWFCHKEDVGIWLAQVVDEDGALCACPEGRSFKVRKSDFVDFLWARGDESDLIAFHRYLNASHV